MRMTSYGYSLHLMRKEYILHDWTGKVLALAWSWGLGSGSVESTRIWHTLEQIKGVFSPFTILLVPLLWFCRYSVSLIRSRRRSKAGMDP
jgi:hypothetical protein